VPQATTPARQAHKQEQLERIEPDRYDLNRYPLTSAHETHWQDTLWATALLEPQDPVVADALVRILSLTRRSPLTPTQQRITQMALQISNQLYLHHPKSFAALEPELRATIHHSPHPDWVALALSTLTQDTTGITEAQRQSLVTQVQQRFPDWQSNLALYTTLTDLDTDLTRANQASSQASEFPPLTDLLHWSIAPNQQQLYVLCRRDRGVLCRTVLRDQTGAFVREGNVREGEQLWSVLLSGRSLHQLPWNFRRGETPQGIYRIEGVIPQPDTLYFYAFGLFPLVNLYVPYEAGVKAFVPEQTGTLQGGIGAYRQLLPPSWRGYFGIEQTYWAGKLGRTFFRVHGTGEATDFFHNNRRYPLTQGWNPAIGCLSALEHYDPDTGKLLQADMPKILAALARPNGTDDFSGYMVVVEVPEAAVPEAAVPEANGQSANGQSANGQSSQEPVSLAQIESWIRNLHTLNAEVSPPRTDR
jgi:hypothetical protein